MELLNNLYTIIGTSDDAQSYTIGLNSECFIYKAHFPEQPITPGVCIIQIASELFGFKSNRSVTLTEIANAKFLSVISPVQTTQVTYKFQKITAMEDSVVKVSVVVYDDVTTFAKLSLFFKLNDQH